MEYIECDKFQFVELKNTVMTCVKQNIEYPAE